MTLVLHIHSMLRWLVLLCAVYVLISSIGGLSGKKPFAAGNKRVALLLIIVCDLQLLMGLALYFHGVNGNWFQNVTSNYGLEHGFPNFFFGIEHPLGMLIGIILIHVGYAGTKGVRPEIKKFRRLFWCTLIGLLVILATIPWPNMKNGIGRPLLPEMPQVNTVPADTAH